MIRVRGAIGLIAACWLVCQAATLTLTPAVLAATLADCTCPLGPDATCPMHHRTGAGPKLCAMQSVSASGAATLQSLLSVVGLVPAPGLAMAPVPTASRIVPTESMATERPSPPDSPPPRP